MKSTPKTPRLALGLVAITTLVMSACSSTKPSSSATSTTAQLPTTPAATNTTSGAPSSKASSASSSSSAGVGTTAPPVVEASPAGDIPDTQAFVIYTPPGANYAVSVPEGWSRTESNGVTSFTDKLNTVRMETVKLTKAPTVDTVTTTDGPAIAAADSSAKLGKVSAITRKVGNGVLIMFERNSPPNDVTGKVYREAVERYVFWNNGTELILTLSGPTGSDNVDPWKKVTDSVTWK